MTRTDRIPCFAPAAAVRRAVPVELVEDANRWLDTRDDFVRHWAKACGFTAAAGQVLLCPDQNGHLAGVAVGGRPDELFALSALPASLPGHHVYRLAGSLTADQAGTQALGWALGAYRFDRYLGHKPAPAAQLVMPAAADARRVGALARAIYLVRDLITTPANDLGPAELVAAGQTLARHHKATVKILRGSDLLKHNYPAVYEVGKASTRPPMLFDMSWGRAGDRRLTLVGKGVVFDTGGYDIKTGGSMLTMKKDMGGAAHALALAQLVMELKLPVRLRVLIAAVENSIAGNAFRPSDIIRTRAGKSVEIGSTDAEGRLILADCLTEAATDKPEWLIDFATLTGARNIALGLDVPALFASDEVLAAALEKAAVRERDPLWRLPLHQPYWSGMKSPIADMNNAGAGGNAGAITAALFLQQFVPAGQAWAHFDFNAYNVTARPGRPVGGEAMALRACLSAVEVRFAPEPSRPAKSKARGRNR